MTQVFQKTAGQQRMFDGFQKELDELCARIAPYADCASPEPFLQFRQRFSEKLNDFFSEGRKFNLAVVGQVKSGKSTFLNMLLFGGEQVLPRAATPKTAVLTRMEYAEHNELLIEYYTRGEWEQLRRMALSPLQSPQALAAGELLRQAAERGIPLDQCFSRGTERFTFSDDLHMAERIGDYVAADGMFSPAVRSVTLRLTLEGLRGLSVIDTPGLNDPVRSRAEKTRRLIETCDAAFFLSRSSYFLDRNDLALLTSQLPQKGVNHLTLIASQFDSALMDTLPDYATFQEAVEGTKRQLCRHAAKNIEQAVCAMRREGGAELLLPVVERCKAPVFVSAAAQRMAQKSAKDFDGAERLIFRSLSRCGELSPGQLESVGNFGAVREAFDSLVGQKDEALRKKASSFALLAQSDLQLQLREAIGQTDEQMRILSRRKEELAARQIALTERINRLQDEVGGAFDEYLAPLNAAIADAMTSLWRLQQEWSGVEEKADIQIRTKSEVVSDSKLLLPWTWRRRRTVYTSEETSCSYLDPQDARQNLKTLYEAASQLQSAALFGFHDTARLTNRLFETACRHCLQEGDAAQPKRFEDAARRALERLQILSSPPVDLEEDALLPQFTLLARTDADQQRLCLAVSAFAETMIIQRRQLLQQACNRLRSSAQAAARDFCDALCEDWKKRRNATNRELLKLEAVLGRREEYRDLLGRFMR